MAKSADIEGTRAQPPEGGAVPAVERPSRFAGSGGATALRLLIVAVVLAIWQIGSDTEVFDPFYVSSPSAVAAQVWEFFSTGEIWRHMLVTGREAMAGYVSGAIVGVLIGFILGYAKLLSRIFLPLLNLLNTLPRVALAPLFILWFGIGELSKIVLVFTVVIVIMIFNTYAGTQTVDRDIVTNARLLGANGVQVMRKITLPWCLPWIMAGLRVALAWSLGGAVVAEYLAAREGLGFLIFQYSGSLDQTGLLAGCVVLLMISGVLFALLGLVERRLLRWRPEAGLGG